MKIAIHQPNFVPHFGFFYKMSQADVFIILAQVQFEKNGYQNRYFLQEKQKWVTKPVHGGIEPIFSKYYTDGTSLLDTNLDFITWIAGLLGIETNIVLDIPTNSRSTQRLIDNMNYYGGTVYVTNPSAKDKYLDEDMIKAAGIDIEYSTTQNANLNILEMFERFGIEGTKSQLYKSKKEISNASN
jgi:hypothetical protein